MPQSTQSDPYAKYMEPAPDPYEKYLTPAPSPYDQYQKPPWELEAGQSADNPIPEMHPDLSTYDRFKIMWRGGDPEVGQTYLEGRGFQVQPLGGFQYALRRKKGPWYYFDEPKPSFQDVSDVAGDVLSIGGMVGGAALTSPGIATSTLGAAGGAAAAQALRSRTGAAMGIETKQPGQELKEIGEEAVIGGASELIGAGVPRLFGRLSGRLGRLGKAAEGAPRPKVRPSPDLELPATPPAGVAVDQETWEHIVRNRPDTARLLAFGSPDEVEVAARSQLPAGQPATRDEIEAALKALGPRDPAVVEFLRRTASERTGQAKGELRSMFFQLMPDEDATMRQVADIAARAKLRPISSAKIEEFLNGYSVHFWAKDAMKLAMREENAENWIGALVRHFDQMAKFGESNLKAESLPGWARTILNDASNKDPVDAAKWLETIQKLLSERKPSPYSHMTQEQLAELFYRQDIHGLSEQTVKEVIDMAKGMPAKEVDDMIHSLSHRFPYSPEEKGLFGPVVDLEERAAEKIIYNRVPLKDQVDFWRSIPIDAVRKLQLPDGRILQLTRDQAQAARHIITDIAVHGFPRRRAVSQALIKLEKALKTPKRLIFRALKYMGLDFLRNWKLGRVMGAPLALVGVGFGGVGGATAAVAGLSAALGNEVGFIGRAILTDSNGSILRTIMSAASRRLSKRIGRVLKILGGGPRQQTAFRLGVYELMHDPEFRRLAEEQ